MKQFKAIAAMSLNRVIGREGKIPWHLPEDFKWFKQMTIHQVVVMGRKTFESLGRPLPHRSTVVLSRSAFSFPGVKVIGSLDEIDPTQDPREIFICGGAQIYSLALPRCSDLYLTVVQQQLEGDAFFPAFEDDFEMVARLQEYPQFKIIHYHRRQPA
jgi:dihydrofolate reductase